METKALLELLGIDPSLHDLWAQLDADTQTAAALVHLCASGCDGKLRERYALKWWSEFLPERVTLSAMTASSLQEFTAELSRRLHGQIGGWQDGEAHRQAWLPLIGLPPERQRAVLDILETQASVAVTLCRANADARRRNYGEEKERAERDVYARLFAARRAAEPASTAVPADPVAADPDPGL